MDYFRSQDSTNEVPTTTISNASDVGIMLNVVNQESYNPDYWNVPYTSGLSPMKQIEGSPNKNQNKA